MNGAIIDMKRGIYSGWMVKKLVLTKNDLFISAVFVQSTDEIVPRDSIIRKLWDDERFVNDNTLTVNVTRLRQKLAELGLGEAIVTKKGLGYMAVTL